MLFFVVTAFRFSWQLNPVATEQWDRNVSSRVIRRGGWQQNNKYIHILYMYITGFNKFVVVNWPIAKCRTRNSPLTVNEFRSKLTETLLGTNEWQMHKCRQWPVSFSKWLNMKQKRVRYYFHFYCRHDEQKHL